MNSVVTKMPTGMRVKLSDLLAVNGRFLYHVENSDKNTVDSYAKMPAETQPPIRVTRNLRIILPPVRKLDPPVEKSASLLNSPEL